ncbi:MAG: hypothetical protein JWP75_3881 [Frondihabitans sp.]|nr:hypothetical protein [Frondihabitans sp.]
MPEHLRAQSAHLLAGEMLIRAATEDNGGAREFTGIAVPWGDEADIWGLWRESFDPGAVQDSDEALVFYRHSDVIGKITANRDTDAGWEITGVISRTPAGDEAYTLLRDGVINRLSVGFEPIEYRVDENDTVIHTKVRVREISIVPFPAYDNAVISEVRSATDRPSPMKEDNMDPEEFQRRLDAALLQERTENSRQFDALTARIGDSAGAAVPQFRSMGEFIKAIANGEDNAIQLHRAYTGGQLADAVNANVWLADAIKLVARRRKVLSTFHTETLPARGMTLEYAKLKSDTTVVDKQAKEGDNLKFGKVQLDTGSTTVDTYGGYTEFSRQVIERAEVAYLNTGFRAMSIKYAVQTEAAARATLNAAIASAPSSLVADLATASRNDVLDLLIDAVELFDDNGFVLDGTYVAKDVFKNLAHLEDSSGRPVMNVTGQGINQTGSVSVADLSGNVAQVTFKLLPGAAPGTAAFYDAEAMTTWESSGAPYQLQDENIINLTKQFSVYGYLASAVQYPQAIVPVKKNA